MLNKHNLCIAALCAKEGYSHTMPLSKLLVHPDFTIESDGHQMVRITTQDEKPDSFPEVPGAGVPLDTWEPFLLDAHNALAVLKSLPGKTTIPILGFAAVTRPEGSATPCLVTTDLERSQIFRTAAPDKNPRTPDYERAIPKTEDADFTIGIDAAQLLKVLKIVEPFARGSQYAPVQFYFNGPHSAVRLEATNPDTHQQLTGVLMPMYKTGFTSAGYERSKRAETLLGDFRAQYTLVKAAFSSTDMLQLADDLFAAANELSVAKKGKGKLLEMPKRIEDAPTVKPRNEDDLRQAIENSANGVWIEPLPADIPAMTVDLSILFQSRARCLRLWDHTIQENGRTIARVTISQFADEPLKLRVGIVKRYKGDASALRNFVRHRALLDFQEKTGKQVRMPSFRKRPASELLLPLLNQGVR
jgi:hypothetical protein